MGLGFVIIFLTLSGRFSVENNNVHKFNAVCRKKALSGFGWASLLEISSKHLDPFFQLLTKWDPTKK